MNTRPEQFEHLPLPHRCAILYLTAPVLIWLVGWFEWWFGVPAALLVGLALAPALRGGWRPPWPSAAALGIVALGVACTMLTAHGGVFDGNNPDWWDRRALLLDVSRHPWPVYVRDGLADYLPWGGGERVALMRYYLAWYMVPGLAGRLFGPGALNWAVPLWSGAGLALALLLFARGFRGRSAVLAAGLLVLFGGMDVLRQLLRHGPESFGLRLDRLGWPGIDVSYGEWVLLANRMTLYPSFFDSFRWSNDILGAALYALLILHLRRHPRFVAASGVVLATAGFWSPFVAFGLLPFVAILVWENRHRLAALGSWSNLCLAVPLVGMLAFYLSSGATDFGDWPGWLWEGTGWRRILRWTIRFYVIEFLLLVLFLLLLRPRLMRNGFFVAMFATLLLLPWYQHHAAHEVTVKGALPALVLLAWFCARTLLAPEDGMHGGAPEHARGLRRNVRRAGFCGVVCCLGVGATGVLLHLAQVTRDDVVFSFAASGLTTVASEGMPRENLAPEVPPLLAAVLRDPVVEAPGAAGEPVFRADFDVHVRKKNIVLVNHRCDRNDRLLRVRFPAPDTNARTHFDRFDTAPRWHGGGCGAVVSLPGWRHVYSARVGQTPPDGGDWAVEVLFDESGEAVGVSRPPRCALHWGESGRRCPANPGIAVLRGAYERTRSGPPAAQSRFDVYIDDEWITHVREPCVFDDMEARFFLHLLRDGGRFDNRDFAFGERGALFDGKCVAVLRLPYPVREVRTGQFSASGEIWSATVRPVAQ